MNPINTYIDKDGTIYWDKFSCDFSPIPCPFTGRSCSGLCPHVYVFEGMNETIMGFTCGQKTTEFEVELKWHEKPTSIKYAYGIGRKHTENKEFVDALKNHELKGNLGRYDCGTFRDIIRKETK